MLTRDGGRWTKPPSSREPTKPYFHAVLRRRRRRGRAVGLGPAGRLAAQEALPGEERRIGQVVAGGRDLLAHRRRGSATLDGRRWCAAARRRHRRPAARRRWSGRPRPGRARRPAGPGPGRCPGCRAWPSEVVDVGLGPGADGLGHRLRRPTMEAGNDHVVEVRSSDAGGLERVGHGLLGQRARRRTRRSAPPTGGCRGSPGVRQRSRNSPVALATADGLGHDLVALAEQQGSGGVAAVGLVGPTGQPGADVADHGEPAGRRRPRCTPPRSSARHRSRRRPRPTRAGPSAACTAVALVLSA